MTKLDYCEICEENMTEEVQTKRSKEIALFLGLELICEQCSNDFDVLMKVFTRRKLAF